MGHVHESVFLRDSYKKGRLHTNADGLSRMTYEPIETQTPTVTDNLTDDNFVNAMDLKMSERDFNSWMIQLPK